MYCYINKYFPLFEQEETANDKAPEDLNSEVEDQGMPKTQVLLNFEITKSFYYY